MIQSTEYEHFPACPPREILLLKVQTVTGKDIRNIIIQTIYIDIYPIQNDITTGLYEISTRDFHAFHVALKL